MFNLPDYYAGFTFMKPELSPRNKPLLFLTCVGVKERTYPEYIIDNSTRDTYTYRFQYTISGSGILEMNGQKHVVNPHDAFFLFAPSNSKYYANPDSQVPWRFVYLTFIKSPPMASAVNTLMESIQPVFHLEPECGAIRSLVNLINKRKTGIIHEPLLASAAALDFFYQLYYSVTEHQSELSPRNKKAVTLIEEQYPFLNGVEDIAERLRVSPGYLTREFAKELGVTPIEYLSQTRINQACILLESSNLSMKEISSECGFTSPSYFSKVFRKYKKISPGQYREMNL